MNTSKDRQHVHQMKESQGNPRQWLRKSHTAQEKEELKRKTHGSMITTTTTSTSTYEYFRPCMTSSKPNALAELGTYQNRRRASIRQQSQMATLEPLPDLLFVLVGILYAPTKGRFRDLSGGRFDVAKTNHSGGLLVKLQRTQNEVVQEFTGRRVERILNCHISHHKYWQQ